MARVLGLFAHPALEKSRVHQRLVAQLPSHPDLTFHDLYEAYPRLDVDVHHEQGLLVDHDVIVFQFPFYWYSTPPILKQWQDLVLEHGWAYGSRGTALAGKHFVSAVSAGASASAYEADGFNTHTVRQLLAPLERTAILCRMACLPPFVIFGTHGLTETDIEQEAVRYRRFLEGLLGGRAESAAHAPDDDLNAIAEGWWAGGVA